MSELRIGVVHWEAGDGMASAIAGTLIELGHTAVEISPEGALPGGLDLILLWGPLGSPVPIATRLIEAPARTRPRLVLWQTEQSWDPRLPSWIAHPASVLRAWLDRRRRGRPVRAARPLRRGLRFRYFGDLLWLKRNGLPDVLAVPSDWYAEFLSQRGIDNITAYIGAYPGWGADLGLERDIPVLWIGKPGSRRRIKMLRSVRSALKRRGIRMKIVDGIESPYVFGRERIELLNRTKIVLNILRQPWDANALRYYLAAANGAMILTEPTLAHNPFKAGVHIVESDPARLAGTAAFYLEHEPERARIAANSRELVETELTMRRQVSKILSEVARI
jgi:hypothetical protein